jgi:hypothetical protein
LIKPHPRTPDTHLRTEKKTPSPNRSRSGCITATLPAAREHRAILPEAAAVLRVSRWISTSRVLKVWAFVMVLLHLRERLQAAMKSYLDNASSEETEIELEYQRTSNMLVERQ